MSVATDLVLEALRGQVAVIHLDTADRRNLSNIGRIDPANVLLAAFHGLKYLYLLAVKRPSIVYLPIAQDRLAFLRDCLFLLPARVLRKKLVIHLHGGHFGDFFRTAPSTLQRIVRFALGKTDRAIVLCTGLGSIFEGIIPRSRVRTIPNGIPDHFKDSARKVPNSRRIVLFLSTLMKEKGTLDLLHALPAIAKYSPDVKAVFAGEWYRSDDKKAADELIQALGITALVEFVGPVAPPYKYDLLREGDVFVLPTYNEGQPYAVLEAMSASLPVVSTNVGCIAETVVDGGNGFFVEPGCREALAERVLLLLNNEELRKEMADASRQRFLKLYTFERFAGDIQRMFAELSS